MEEYVRMIKEIYIFGDWIILLLDVKLLVFSISSDLK